MPLQKLNEQKEILNELVLSSTVIGLPNFFRTKRLIFKIIWLLALTSSACICVYFVSKTVVDFLNHEVVTTITEINDSDMEFPTISICNEYNKSFEFKPRRLNLNFNDWISDWKSHIEPFNDPYYGNCYKFNSGYDYYKNPIDIKLVQGSGTQYGFELELFVENTIDENALIIFINNHTAKPISLFEKEIFLNFGATHYFTLYKILDNKLGEPYNNCLEDVTKFDKNKTLINYILYNKTSKYSQFECIRLCEKIKFFEDGKCDCNVSSLEDIVYQKCFDIIRNSIVANCTKKFKQKFNKNKPFEYCSKYCPMKCNSINYDIKLNSVYHPKIGNITDSLSLIKFPNYDSFESVSRNFISLKIFFKELKYTLINQQAKTEIFDLVSNIGGLFGLFLGMGLLSFMELGELFFETVVFLFFKKAIISN